MKNKSLIQIISYKSGFSMAEALITMLIIGFIATAMIPMMTKMSFISTGNNENVVKCVLADSATWYDNATGVTSDATADSYCAKAIEEATYNRSKALQTVTWYADHGTTNQKTMGKKILRAACDKGGGKACDYFINLCWKDGSSSAPYCDDTSSFLDLTYYMHQNYGTTTNEGARYIKDKMDDELSKLTTKFINEASYACSYNQTPNYGQNLNSNIACDLIDVEFLINACNDGYTGACETAYAKGYNTSCYAVKTNWADATTGTYKLSPDGSATTRDVDCNMTSLAYAAISGCEASTYVSGDCTAGYNNTYNRTCHQIFTNIGAVDGTYHLTFNGAPPTARVEKYCDSNNGCATEAIGHVCDDNTVYAGYSDTSGYIYFTTPTDTGDAVSWNNGTSPVGTWVTADVSGAVNTAALTTAAMLAHTDAPFIAVELCDDLSYGDPARTDWFLPVMRELEDILYDNRIAIGNFEDNVWYWSSCEGAMSNGAKNLYFSDDYPTPLAGALVKTSASNVRCMRQM